MLPVKISYFRLFHTGRPFVVLQELCDIDIEIVILTDTGIGYFDSSAADFIAFDCVLCFYLRFSNLWLFYENTSKGKIYQSFSSDTIQYLQGTRPNYYSYSVIS